MLSERLRSGPCLVSRTGDLDQPKVCLKQVIASSVMQTVLAGKDSRNVVMEVETVQRVCNNSPAKPGSLENLPCLCKFAYSMLSLGGTAPSQVKLFVISSEGCICLQPELFMVQILVQVAVIQGRLILLES